MEITAWSSTTRMVFAVIVLSTSVVIGVASADRIYLTTTSQAAAHQT
jgi:hypothetical protein